MQPGLGTCFGGYLLAQENIAVNLRDESGKTPLHFAAKHPITTIVTALSARQISNFKTVK